MSKPTEPRWALWLEWAALLIIIILAVFFRYWRITEVPPGFNSDEAVGAMGALTTLREGFKYSYEGQGGGGALGFYFATVAFYLFGPSIATMRGLAAWAGVVSIFVNYWAVREIFRSTSNHARWLAGLSTLGLALSLWHISASRIAFAGIGVPFLMLPSVYFLWLGLNKAPLSLKDKGWSWIPFVASGIFLGALMYIYLSGVFAPPLYAAFFIAQWLIIKFWQKTSQTRFFRKPGVLPSIQPPSAYLTSHFWGLLVTALTATLLLLPIALVLLTRPELEPGATRVSQAFFLNPQINQGDPWGLLWRSFTGNFSAYGVSLTWLMGQPPRMSFLPVSIGLMVFLGFLITLWRALRGNAGYLFMLLWFIIMLWPSILAPDIIPHDLRAIGATTPVYVFAAVFIITLFEALRDMNGRWLQPRLGPATSDWLVKGATILLALGLAWNFYQVTAASLYRFFVIFPETNDAKAAYHVYAVKMAEVINAEPSADVAFILPRNTAAGEVFRNFTTDFLTELAQPPAAHYWVVDDERILPAALTEAAARRHSLRLVKWKTSKHTGADPKQVMPYYLEKFGHYDHTDTFEYFDIDTYQLDTADPNFDAAETLQPLDLDFGGQIHLTGYALGDAGDAEQVTQAQAHSNDLLWLRLAWHKIADHPENLKASALVYTQAGQLVAQIDKLLVSNILQVGSAKWPVDAQESSYFLIPIPAATPPGPYTLRLAVYGEESLTRLPVSAHLAGGDKGVYTLADFTVLPAQNPVNPANLKLALPIKQELLPGLTLLGFETLPGEGVRSGAQVGASVIWQAGDKPLPDNLRMAFSVKPAEGDDEWPLSEPVGLAGSYNTRQWQPGEILRGWLTARIPPQFEPGIYKLRLRLTTPDQPDKPVQILPIGEFKVEGWPRNFDAPQPQLKIEANFAGQALLTGLDLPNHQLPLTLLPGDTLNLQLYWRAEAEFAQDYTAFVHLLGPDGQVYGQVDQTPGGGAFPTTGWLPGEYITDAYTISVPSTAPSGDYHLEIGLYDPHTGQRLPVQQLQGQTHADDKILLPGLTVQ